MNPHRPHQHGHGGGAGVGGAMPNHRFEEDKLSWENAIRAYNANDPLDLWFNYISWYEQNRAYDRVDNLRSILEKCLTLYQDNESFKQDVRMVKLWLKYIDMQQTPGSYYQMLYKKNIGTQCACFYIAWAHYYDAINGFKQAESIYNLGMQMKARPMEELQEAQRNFRQSLADRRLYGESLSKKRSASTMVEQRQQIVSHSPPQKKLKHETSGVGEYQYAEQAHPQVHAQAPAMHTVNGTLNSEVPQAAPGTSSAGASSFVNHAYYHQQQRTTQQPVHQQQVAHTATNASNMSVQGQQSYYVKQHNGIFYPSNGQHNGYQQPTETTVQTTLPSVAPSVVPSNHNQCVEPPPPQETYDSSQQHVSYQPADEDSTRLEESCGERPAEANDSLDDSLIECNLNNSAYVITASLSYVYDDSLGEYTLGETTGQPTVVETSEPPAQVATPEEASHPSDGGIRLPANFVREAKSNHETWDVPLCLEEPYDPKRRCRYPKRLVYPDLHAERPTMEFSLEEIRAQRWFARRRQEQEAQMPEAKEKVAQRQVQMKYPQQQQQPRIYQQQYPSSSGHQQTHNQHGHSGQPEQPNYQQQHQQQQQPMRQGSIQHTSNFYHQQQQQPHGPYHGYNGYNGSPGGGQIVSQTMSQPPVQTAQLIPTQPYQQSSGLYHQSVIQNHGQHQSPVQQQQHHQHMHHQQQQQQQQQHHNHHQHQQQQQHHSPVPASQLNSPTPTTANAVQPYPHSHQHQYAPPLCHSPMHSPPMPYHQQPAQRQYDGYQNYARQQHHHHHQQQQQQQHQRPSAPHRNSYQTVAPNVSPYGTNVSHSPAHGGQHVQPMLQAGGSNHQNYAMPSQSPIVSNSNNTAPHVYANVVNHQQHHHGHVHQQYQQDGSVESVPLQQSHHVQQQKQQHVFHPQQHQQYNHAPEQTKVQQEYQPQHHVPQGHVQKQQVVVMHQTRVDETLPQAHQHHPNHPQQQQQQQQNLPQAPQQQQTFFGHQQPSAAGASEGKQLHGVNGQGHTQHQQQQQQQRHHHNNNNNNNGKYNSNDCDDIEEQIEASTIRFSTPTENGTSKSKTITIKFKKEKASGVGSPLATTGSEGSARSPYQGADQHQQQQQYSIGSESIVSGGKKHVKHHTSKEEAVGVVGARKGKEVSAGGKDASRSKHTKKKKKSHVVDDADDDDVTLVQLLSRDGGEKDEDSSFSVQSVPVGGSAGSSSSSSSSLTAKKSKTSKRSSSKKTVAHTRRPERYELEEEYQVEDDADEDGVDAAYADDEDEDEDDEDEDDGVQDDDYYEEEGDDEEDEEEEVHDNDEDDEDDEEEEEEFYGVEEEEVSSTEEGMSGRVVKNGRRGGASRGAGGEPTKRIVRPDEDDSSYQSNSEFNTSFSNISFAGDNSNGPFQYGSGGGGGAGGSGSGAGGGGSGGGGAGGGGSGRGSACSTPIRRTQTSSMGGFSKTSTPVGSFRYLRKHESNLSNLGQNEDSMNSTVVESSFFQAGEHDEEAQRRRLEKALATIETHLARPFIDPFNSELCRAFLTKVDFPARGRDPSDEEHPYCLTHANLPKLVKGQTTNLGGTAYSVEKEVGRGSYGSVFRAVNTQTGAVVAIKYQKPANTWELYICTEVKKRLTNDIMLPGFMDICDAVIAPNASVLVSEFSQYGSLLDINNKIRTATTKVMHESLVMHFSCQILSIVEYLHACNIIHADIKPDNFLLMKIPSRDLEAPTIRLIDFGCAIDMNFFEPKRQFKKVIQTDGFTCIEMQEGRPWSFQTDLFCVAGTIHVMLFGEYMQIVKKYEWDIKQKLPRYLKKHVWTEVFQKLLNIKDIDHMPSLPKLRELINSEAYKMDSELTKHIRTLSNLLKSR